MKQNNKTYYLGGMSFNSNDVICHGRTKGSRNGISTTPGYKAIGELAKGVVNSSRNGRRTNNSTSFVIDKASNRVRSFTNHPKATADSSVYRNRKWVSKPKNLKERFTGENYKRTADMARSQASDYRGWSATATNIAYNKHLPTSHPAYNRKSDGWRHQAATYANDASLLETKARILDEKYENAPRQRINRAVNDGKEWAAKTVTSAGKTASRVYDDASKWVNQAGKDVGKTASKAYNSASKWANQAAKDIKAAPKKALDAVSNQDELEALLEFSGAHYDKNTGEWDSEENAAEYREMAKRYFDHPVTIASNTVKDIGDWGGKAIDDAKRFLDSNGVFNAVDSVKKAYGDASKWVNQAGKDVGKTASKAYGDASKWVNQAGKDVSKTASKAYGDASKWVNQAGKDVSKTASKAYNDVSSKLSTAAKGASGAAAKAYSDASKWVNQAGKDVGKTASKAYNDASKWVNQAGKDVGKTASKAYNDASKWANQAGKDVGKAASKAGRAIGSGTKSAVNAGKKAAKDIGNWGGNQLKKGKKFLKSIFG